MASVNDEENVTNESGRRTRSGRKVAPTPPSPATKTRRRSSRKQAEEQAIEPQPEIIQEEEEEVSSYSQQSDIIKEMLAEAAQGVIGEETRSHSATMIQHHSDIIEEEIQTELVSEEEMHRMAVDEAVFHEIIEEDMATDLIEEEVHTEIVDSDLVQEEIITDLTEIAEEEVLTETVSDNEMDAADGGINANNDDEKSSSFPFGSVVHNENSENGQNEAIAGESEETNTNECVESSLLASLAGDNANSLPSVGEEEIESKNFVEKLVQPAVNEDDDSISEPAIAEDIHNNSSDATLINTEMVSEDELPMPTKPKVNDAEEVSDDELPVQQGTDAKVNDAEEVSDEELPAPQRAELPADTEVVSEDEFPSNVGSSSKKNETRTVKKKTQEETDELQETQRAELPEDTEVVSEDEFPSNVSSSAKKGETPAAKRKAPENKANEEYNPSSPTSESNDGPVEKKVKVQSDDEEQKESKKEKEKKKFPNLEKFWKVVKDDPADFTGWTYLLQYVDQEADIEAAREAFDAFLSQYPYCYGYWRKYADCEKRKGLKTKCDEVIERGLKAIPLSVDLWIHYLAHVKANHGDNVDYIRSQFERAIDACGMEFRSDKLWDSYIRWETESKRYQNAIKIYDRLLTVPTQTGKDHFDNFKDLVNNHPATSLIDAQEFKKLRSEVREALKASKESSKQQEIAEGVPGVESDEDVDESEEADYHVRNDEEMAAIKDKIISTRRKLYKISAAAASERWDFENAIKRPYFHVKPLERCQLKNWKDYLDYEIEKGDRKRILILFERCLIACALYDEFWLKLIRYLESQSDPELIPITRDAYTRACTIHHSDKPSLHLMWAAFEECQNDFDKAAEILVNLEKICPNLLQIAYRRINVERRRGDYDKCKELYEHYISTAKNKNIAGSLAIKYARFCNKISGDLDAGMNVLRKALEKDPANTRVALQMIDIALQRPVVDENEVVQIMDSFMSRENIDLEQRVLFAQRKVEFLEDFGSKASGLLDAQRALQVALNKANEAKKKSETSPNKKSSATGGKEAGAVSNPAHATAAYSNNANSTANYNYGSGTNSSYYGQSGQAYQQPQQQQQYDGYYNHWQYGSGYSGYGQWSGYGNYY